MTQCKKQPFLSRDCHFNLYNPYAIDIEGACRKSGAKEFCSITVSSYFLIDYITLPTPSVERRRLYVQCLSPLSESCKGFWFLSCEEAIQQANIAFVVLRMLGTWSFPPPVKLESCHMVITILVPCTNSPQTVLVFFIEMSAILLGKEQSWLILNLWILDRWPSRP
jgi:hypothetical protein